MTGPSNPMSTIFQDMMKPKLLYYALSWVLPSQKNILFHILSDLRIAILNPTFLHAEHGHSQEPLKLYWSQQLLLAQKGPSNQLHPALQSCTLALQNTEEWKQPVFAILEGFVYEIDTQWHHFNLPMQRERCLSHLAKIWELLWPTPPFNDLERTTSIRDRQWCQQVLCYQYRGLFISLFDIDPTVFDTLRAEIDRYQPSTHYANSPVKILITYHRFMAKISKSDIGDQTHTYVKPSKIGTASFLFSLFFNNGSSKSC